MATPEFLPESLRSTLLANARDRERDHVPVLKLFNPVGAATWLATELDEDGDSLFGLADLGMGFAELGSFSLAELQSARLPFGLSIERDASFRTRFPISVWANHARATGSIAEAEQLLRRLPSPS